MVESWWQSTYDCVIHWDTNLWFSFCWGFPGGLGDKESACNAGNLDSIWVRKIPWRRAWQPTPILLPGEFHGRRSLGGYTVCGGHKSWTRPSDWHFHFFLRCHSIASWLFWNGQVETSRDALLTCVTSSWSPHGVGRPGLTGVWVHEMPLLGENVSHWHWQSYRGSCS